MADERKARKRRPDARPDRTRRADRPDRPPGAGERASPVPGPGTEGAEEGYHPMHAPEERRPDARLYDVSPSDMPPASAGANADIGGEAAASRRLAGRPDALDRRERASAEAAAREPVLGYDGLSTNDVLGWIFDADPEPDVLRRIRKYEESHRRRDPILQECEERLRRLGS